MDSSRFVGPGTRITQSLDHDQVNTCIHELIGSRAAQQPDTIAVVCEGSNLSYRELNHRANQLAHHLMATEVQRESLVGVFMDRSVDMVVALLGILKAGAAYVPLDPTYPRERLTYMAQDAALSCVLTHERAHDRAWLPAGVPAICVDECASKVDEMPTVDPDSGVGVENLAYVIYTSGSTGQPKGVMVEHRNAASFFAAVTHALPAGTGGTWLAATSISFDPSVVELLWTLSAGRTVEVVLQQLPERWSTDVRSFQCTPSIARLLLRLTRGRQLLGQLELLVVTGETLRSGLLSELQELVSGSIVNAYGPTEATVWSCVADVSETKGTVPIGVPVLNATCDVANTGDSLAGTPGELLIGGAGVVRGYLGNDELTAERFVWSPRSDGQQERVYRTGDLVQWGPDGLLQFLGRIDDQMKIHGVRMEPAEVEVVLRRHDDVVDAAVAIRDDELGGALVACVVLESQTPPNTTGLREFIGRALPRPLIPSNFVFVKKLPLSPSGKVDRAQITKMLEQTSLAGAVHEQVDSTFATAWAKVLGKPPTTDDDDFFESGGHSLHALLLCNRLSEALDCEIPVGFVFDYPRYGEMLAAIKENSGA